MEGSEQRSVWKRSWVLGFKCLEPGVRLSVAGHGLSRPRTMSRGGSFRQMRYRWSGSRGSGYLWVEWGISSSHWSVSDQVLVNGWRAPGSWLVWRVSPGAGVGLGKHDSSQLSYRMEQPTQSPNQKQMFVKDWLMIRGWQCTRRAAS